MVIKSNRATDYSNLSPMERIYRAVFTKSPNKVDELLSGLSSIVSNLQGLEKDEILDKLVDCVNYLVEFTQPDFFDNEDGLPF